MSPSPLKSETARVNGALSSGPVTPEGKAASATNSLRHGLCSKQVVLPGEDPAEFERTKASYFETYKPQSDAEKDQVVILAATSWRLRRMMQIEAGALMDENSDPLKTLGLLTRYEGQLNRTHERALKNLKELQEARAAAARKAARRNEPTEMPLSPEKMAKMTPEELELAVLEIMTAPVPAAKASGAGR